MRRLLSHLHRRRLFSPSLPPPPRLTALPLRRRISDAASPSPPRPPLAADVPNKELKCRLETYYEKDDESELPSVAEAVLSRKFTDAHGETDDELVEELRDRPPPELNDVEIEDAFEESHETDEELEDLYNAREYVENKMKSDEFFTMDDKKWDEMIREATELGALKSTKECEEILEDMLHWDKLLPDEIKRKVEIKLNELGEMSERGELEPEEAYKLFKEFEDKMVVECKELMEAAQPSEEDEAEKGKKSAELDDPPGEGPIIRWESRIVFVPGGDSWHPKNRLVKLRVTVKELGLSRYASRRLREVVGKRYHSGKDELTITSERFEHREENRKDCLRTLYAIIEDARKADQLVEEARNAFVKAKLKSNIQFMERLKMKTAKLRESRSISA